MLIKIILHLKLKMRSYVRFINKSKELPQYTKIVKKNTFRWTKTILLYYWVFALSATFGLRKFDIILKVCLRIRRQKGITSITIPLAKIVKNYSISIFELVCKLLLYLISIIASLF
jgi:hypothetical protein